MIQSFADSETELIWAGRRSRKLPPDIQNVALRKLRLLNQAQVLGDLRVPPGNRLEALKADRQGQHSIRINDQWRICFVWDEGGRHMSKSSTTTSTGRLLHNPHPGEILLEEFLKPMGLSQNALARAVHVAPRRINEIVLGKRDITADTDLRLARYFGLSEGFVLGLQMEYDLMQRRREIDRDLKTIRPRAA
jgi:addiction module HigA family antidote